MTQNSRQLAFLALRFIKKGAFADVAVDKVLHQTELSMVDRRLLDRASLWLWQGQLHEFEPI